MSSSPEVVKNKKIKDAFYEITRGKDIIQNIGFIFISILGFFFKRSNKRN